MIWIGVYNVHGNDIATHKTAISQSYYKIIY